MKTEEEIQAMVDDLQIIQSEMGIHLQEYLKVLRWVLSETDNDKLNELRFQNIIKAGTKK